jgi:hypothetical protein
MFAAESTPAPCGPPAIQLISFILFHSLNEYSGINLRFLTASHCVRAYTAVATRRFAAVWANTFAVINGIAASLT